MAKVFKRRWFQFTLRTLLGLATLLCVWLGWWANRAHQQRLAVAQIQSLSGAVDYVRRPNDTRVPKWLRELVGDDFFVNVNQVFLTHRMEGSRDKALTPEELDQLVAAMRRLPKLRRLTLSHTGLRDEDMSRLAPLRKRIEFIAICTYTSEVDGRCIEHFRDWPRLKSLAFLCSHPDPQALERLVALPSLERFDWSDCELDAKAFARIARCRKLRVLGLNQCRFDGNALTGLRAAPCLKTLALLNIYVERSAPADGNDEGDASLFYFRPVFGFGDDNSFGPREDVHDPNRWVKRWLPDVETTQGFIYN